ncbi:MAG: sensor histidine kinase [Anaerolineales bacterium]|nr:sensor histidine kinase [Anaerolineales bacterium]
MNPMPLKMFIPSPDAPNPFFRRFSNLRWKLAFSYVGVTLLTILALELIVLLLLGLFGEPAGDLWVTQTVLENSNQLAELVSEPLEDGSEEELAKVLYQPVGLVFKAWISQDPEAIHWLDETRVVVDTQGIVVASNLPERYVAGTRFQEQGFPQAENLIQEALENSRTASHLSKEINVFAAAVPVYTRERILIGALYYHQPRPAVVGLSAGALFGPLAITTLVLLPCMIPLGLIFSFVTASGFTRRLRRLSEVSLALADGDLSRRVADDSGDEIGLLSRRFNRMAEELQADTVRLRDLAAVEERQRLARDLHDGIKQNLFGTSLAAAAAVNLLDTDPEASREKMLEAAEHNRRAQGEMKVLLEELRPAGFGECGLPAALKEYLTAFGGQHGMETAWTSSGSADLPPDRQQALFRITQEALTNVRRHAHAQRVSIDFSAEADAITLRIEDDGKGFDSNAAPSPAAMGLQGIRGRLAEFGGVLEIESSPGSGTRLVIRLPFSGSSGRGKAHA